ncbi:MAG: hypothetical protein ACI88A_001784 [Paraglaciecola sp.]|jgi:hypothetical protein
MLLRSITKHLKDQNWFAVGLDFLIVVMGVFMALQVQEWAALRAKADEAKEYYGRLAKEFEDLSNAQKENSNSYDAYYRNGINFTAFLMANNDIDQADFSELAGETFFVVTPQQLPAVLQEMISAGKLGLIENADLRARLLNSRYELLRLEKFAEYLRMAIAPITKSMQHCFIVSSFEPLDDKAPLPENLFDHSSDGKMDITCLRSEPLIRGQVVGWLSALSSTRLRNHKTAEQFEAIAEQLKVLALTTN